MRRPARAALRSGLLLGALAASASAQLAGGATAMAELGRQLFFDTSLSQPAGQACASCHAPAAGFRFPDSQLNQLFGVATGAVRNRVTNRSVPTIGYAAFIPKGPPFAHLQLSDVSNAPPGELLFIGGMFWDGRASTLEVQAASPFHNPNEMNDVAHGLSAPEVVVRAVAAGKSADLFRRVFGAHAFGQPTRVVFAEICKALASYERSEEVSPFTSKFDAFLLGRATLTPEELDGLRLFTGTEDGTSSGAPWVKNAQCAACHGLEDDAAVPSLFTRQCYASIGTPRNPMNPFYFMTDAASNPLGYNPDGLDFIDFGLGDFLYPLNELPVGNEGPGSDGNGDWLAANGAVKVPTLRNVDKRPAPGFVKAYMHNGVFKSLKEVVHFYNTRNLTTAGEVFDLTQPDPYAGLTGTPLWPLPEVNSLTAVANAQGFAAVEGGLVGNLQLTDAEEDHLVAFMQALTDGWFPKNPHAAGYLAAVQGF
jgi:cytochrome c peroxidase